MRLSKKILVAVVAAAAIVGPSAGARTNAARAVSTAQALLDWNTIAVDTVRAARVFQAEGEIYMAYVQAAVFDAVTAIEGGYQPYGGVTLSAPAGASSQAAAVAAAHRILVYHFPAQQTALDAAYATSLGTITDPQSAKDAGVAVGEQAAQAIISLRTGDGRNATIPYAFGSGPGAWVLPTPDSAATTPQTVWIAHMTPFLIESPSQFRSDPPAALSTVEYAEELNEVKAYGGRNSTLRTPEQATIARFWTANVINQYNLWLRSIAAQQRLGTEGTARLLAMGNIVVADASIACWDSKYAYSFWRPVQAIREADMDGSDATTADPTWTPFLAPTPNHPEYPSAHGCLTSALAEVLANVLGAQKIDLDLAGLNPATGALDPNYTRHFDIASELDQELVDARVWAGYHYRQSVVEGVVLGRKVAHWTLRRYFLPAP